MTTKHSFAPIFCQAPTARCGPAQPRSQLLERPVQPCHAPKDNQHQSYFAPDETVRSAQGIPQYCVKPWHTLCPPATFNLQTSQLGSPTKAQGAYTGKPEALNQQDFAAKDDSILSGDFRSRYATKETNNDFEELRGTVDSQRKLIEKLVAALVDQRMENDKTRNREKLHSDVGKLLNFNEKQRLCDFSKGDAFPHRRSTRHRKIRRRSSPKDKKRLKRIRRSRICSPTATFGRESNYSSKHSLHAHKSSDSDENFEVARKRVLALMQPGGDSRLFSLRQELTRQLESLERELSSGKRNSDSPGSKSTSPNGDSDWRPSSTTPSHTSASTSRTDESWSDDSAFVPSVTRRRRRGAHSKLNRRGPRFGHGKHRGANTGTLTRKSSDAALKKISALSRQNNIERTIEELGTSAERDALIRATQTRQLWENVTAKNNSLNRSRQMKRYRDALCKGSGLQLREIKYSCESCATSEDSEIVKTDARGPSAGSNNMTTNRSNISQSNPRCLTEKLDDQLKSDRTASRQQIKQIHDLARLVTKTTQAATCYSVSESPAKYKSENDSVLSVQGASTSDIFCPKTVEVSFESDEGVHANVIGEVVTIGEVPDFSVNGEDAKPVDSSTPRSATEETGTGDIVVSEIRSLREGADAVSDKGGWLDIPTVPSCGDEAAAPIPGSGKYFSPKKQFVEKFKALNEMKKSPGDEAVVSKGCDDARDSHVGLKCRKSKQNGGGKLRTGNQQVCEPLEWSMVPRKASCTAKKRIQNLLSPAEIRSCPAFSTRQRTKSNETSFETSTTTVNDSVTNAWSCDHFTSDDLPSLSIRIRKSSIKPPKMTK